jgi:hypothetical protein
MQNIILTHTITPKPAYSNNPRTATRKATAQKMDARCKPLRQRRWTTPSLLPIGTSH